MRIEDADHDLDRLLVNKLTVLIRFHWLGLDPCSNWMTRGLLKDKRRGFR